MLAINYPKKSIQDKIETEYKKLFGNKRSRDKKFKELCEGEKILHKYKDWPVDKIITMPFDEIAEIASDFREDKISGSFGLSKNVICYTPHYQQKISKFFMQYADELNLASCYFCNIDYINSFKDKYDDTKSHFTLDHMLGKAKNPIFSLSFYNFIPSCYTCNSKLKRDTELINSANEAYLSPSSKNFSFDNDIEFQVLLKSHDNISTINNTDDFELILINKLGGVKYKSYIKEFHLEDRYQFHKYAVKELILKQVKYGDKGKEFYFGDLLDNYDEFIKDVMGREIFEGELNSRSLSKLKRDIYLAFKKT